jgi:hypothetical protein
MSARLAFEDVGGRIGAEHHLVAHSRARPAVEELRRVRDAAIVDHGVLHGNLDFLTAASHRALVKRCEDADAGVKPGAGITERHARLDRPAGRLARDAHDATACLGDHVEGEMLLVTAPLAEALHGCVDDARVQRRDLVVGEAEPLNHAGCEILGKDVGLSDEIAQQLLAALALEIHRNRFLVRIEHHEVVAVRVLPIRRRAASLLSADRVLDLDDLGTEPGECLGNGGARLELREINHFDAGQGRLRHGLRLWHCVHIPYLEHFSSTGASHSIHFPTRTRRVGKGLRNGVCEFESSVGHLWNPRIVARFPSINESTSSAAAFNRGLPCR